jgi:hypothetical protein
MEPLAKDQKVVLKIVKLSGTLLGPHHVDSEDNTEDGRALYKVHFPEQSLWVRRENISVVVPQNPDSNIRYGGREWHEEMQRFSALTEKCLANPEDKAAAMQWSESGSRLGFIIPTK